MGTMTFQITSLTIVYSTFYSGADQRKHQSSASLAFVREFTSDWWILCTKPWGQYRWKYFHLLTSSWMHSFHFVFFWNCWYKNLPGIHKTTKTKRITAKSSAYFMGLSGLSESGPHFRLVAPLGMHHWTSTKPQHSLHTSQHYLYGIWEVTPRVIYVWKSESPRSNPLSGVNRKKWTSQCSVHTWENILNFCS